MKCFGCSFCGSELQKKGFKGLIRIWLFKYYRECIMKGIKKENGSSSKLVEIKNTVKILYYGIHFRRLASGAFIFF